MNSIKSMERSKNKQLAINMMASFVSFVVGFGISFFLTPYIVKSIGREAYGFIGLANNVIGYTSLVTIALNSMAGRFITIEYVEGNKESANKYYSSVFYCNVVLSLFIALVMAVVIWKLELLFNIPAKLLWDVKILFLLLTINSIIGLLTGIYGIATFIKNRLELSSIRSIIGNLIRAVFLIVAFGLLFPKITYFGIAALLTTLYCALTNLHYTRELTPELRVKKRDFCWNDVKKLVMSGAWNVVSKLSDMLEQGLDLVIANVCIGASAMGFYSLTKNVPFLILGIFQMIAGVFAPLFTTLYAQHNKPELVHELSKSIRILGFFTNIPLVFLYVFGDYFYKLWLPGEDSSKLQLLTILGSAGLVFAMPLESLWNIFTITNKLKYSSLTMLLEGILTFLTVMTSLLFVKEEWMGLMILAGASTFWGTLRALFFLPIYGSYCLKLDKKLFYPPVFKSFLSFAILMVICLSVKHLFVIKLTWLTLAFYGIIVVFSCCIVGFIVTLTKKDRDFLGNIAMRYIKKYTN